MHASNPIMLRFIFHYLPDLYMILAWFCPGLHPVVHLSMRPRSIHAPHLSLFGCASEMLCTNVFSMLHTFVGSPFVVI
jgi:hypothetical protein